MAETHTIHDPFLGQDVEISSRLVDRLRGRYAVGPTLATGEPEFGWRKFTPPPIQKEAASEIERLKVRIEALQALLRLHRCNVDGRQTVGECVDAGQCGCSCGLLLK